MAPNNALSERKKVVKKQGTTTVLDAGTVESRGMGTQATTRSQVTAEITEFLTGEAKMSPKAESRAFLTVWTFITRLPGPTWVDHHPGYLMRGMAYFPLAGSLVGGFVCLFFDLANVTFGLPPIVSATICTAASFWVTGCFHEDGLADASDGIGGGWSRKQILTIMTDTRLGTYGCACLLLHTVAKLELIAALDRSQWDFTGNAYGAGPALIVAHALARLTSPYLIRTRDYVDEAGPKYKFYCFMVKAKHLVSWHRVLFAVLSSFALATVFYGPIMAAIMIPIILFVAHLSGAYGEYLLGGIMGDYLGATICLTELLVLTMILVRNTFIKHFEWIQQLQNLTGDGLLEAIMKQDQPIGVLARFLGIMAVIVIYICNVGHPNVLIRETVIEAFENDTGDDIRIGLKLKTPPVAGEIEPTGRQITENICNSSESSFQDRYDAVRIYLDSLAKPVGSLGTLELWAARLAALQRTSRPTIGAAICLIFAADHGTAKRKSEGGEECSAYPQAVTMSVLNGLEEGIAGASVLAKANNVSVRVIDVGVNGASYNGEIVVSSSTKIPSGTKNFCTESAMTAAEVEQCIATGRSELSQYVADIDGQVIILGEVGIGNTTASSALIVQLTGALAMSVCGGGALASREAGIAAVEKKIDIVTRALAFHGPSIDCAMDALQRVGGAEIAALVGAILEASERNLPVLVDGFIVTAAALVAAHICPSTCQVMFFTTQSAEIGQQAAIEGIQKIADQNGVLKPEIPALSMGLRMGEGTAAILAVPILRSAAAILSEMGTIQDILKLGATC
jgi:nicotinate-nucleotide--dimethylbenzimidazole phosphoribosyltransferase